MARAPLLLPSELPAALSAAPASPRAAALAGLGVSAPEGTQDGSSPQPRRQRAGRGIAARGRGVPEEYKSG